MNDLTDKYFDSQYMHPNPSDWVIDRDDFPVLSAAIHHTAGFYGTHLSTVAQEGEEIDQLDSMALDHTARFGIGPAYHYAIMPSGRAYAIGKWGTHRAHTAGRNPETLDYWNNEVIGIVLFGDFTAYPPTRAQRFGTLEVVEEVKRISGLESLTIRGHREHASIPTQRFPHGAQTTTCPGPFAIPWVWDMQELIR